MEFYENCPKCGAQNVRSDPKCGSCGVVFSKMRKPPPPSGPLVPASGPTMISIPDGDSTLKRRKRFPWAGVFLLLIIAGTAAASSHFGGSRFVAHIQKFYERIFSKRQDVKIPSEASVEEGLIAAKAALEVGESNPVRVYSMSSHPATHRVFELLRIYGIAFRFHEIQSSQELESILGKERAKLVTVPVIFFPTGSYISSETLVKLVPSLVVKTLHQGEKAPYVFVYGVEGCTYTQAAEKELKANGIQYKYVDLNTDPIRFRGELEARMKASGFQQNDFNTPIIEVNGYTRPRMSLQELKAKLQ